MKLHPRTDPGSTAAPQRPRRAALVFILRFLAGWAVIVLLTGAFPGIERGAIAGTAACLAALFRAASIPFTVNGAWIYVGGTSNEIAPECTPLFPTAMLWAAFAAFPSGFRWKLAGGLAGAAVLWVYNLVRILAVIGVLIVRPAWADFVHAVMWQTLTLALVVGLFVWWLRVGPAEAGAMRGA